MVQQSFDQISCFSETLFFHLSARFYGHLILTMPLVIENANLNLIKIFFILKIRVKFQQNRSINEGARAMTLFF